MSVVKRLETALCSIHASVVNKMGINSQQAVESHHFLKLCLLNLFLF